MSEERPSGSIRCTSGTCQTDDTAICHHSSREDEHQVLSQQIPEVGRLGEEELGIGLTGEVAHDWIVRRGRYCRCGCEGYKDWGRVEVGVVI